MAIIRAMRGAESAGRLGLVVAGCLALAACGPGPGKLAVSTHPGANNVHLVVSNPGPVAVRPLIVINDRILFDERIEPTVTLERWTTLRSRKYRVDVLDRLSGRTADTKFRLGTSIQLRVEVGDDAIGFVMSDAPQASDE